MKKICSRSCSFTSLDQWWKNRAKPRIGCSDLLLGLRFVANTAYTRNGSEAGTDRPCVYTRSYETVPVRNSYLCSFGSATEAVTFVTVPFGSRVNVQSQIERTEVGTDRK